MNEKKEAREVHYSIARRILNQMLEERDITEEEYRKIDRLNWETFSPGLAKVYAS